MFYKLTGIISITLISLMLQGCMVAAIGAGIGAVKYANAKKTEAKAACNESYNRYLSVMLKNHKTPMSLNDYCKEE
jgi:hypothetical protein